MNFPYLKSTILIFIFAMLVNATGWVILNPAETPIEWHGVLKGIGYTPHQAIESYDELSANPDITVEQIERDFKIFDGKVKNVRIYSSTHGQENVPAIAQQHNMQVMAGAWMNDDAKKNAEEISSVVSLANRYGNINRVLIGNEVLFRKELTPAQLIEYLDQVKPQIHQPISIGEPWHIWINNPELVEHVDFIAVHIFPYWEGVPIENAISDMQRHYRDLQKAFPNKEIVIAEAGWPSKGAYYGEAKASLQNEAYYLREFFNVADQNHYDYYVMEAFDQPWKHSTESATGEHWGIFDATGRQKLPFTGVVYENPWWIYETITALILALIPSLVFLKYSRQIQLRGKFAYFLLIQAFSSLLSYSLFAPVIKGLNAFNISMWGLLLPVQLSLLLVVLINGFEFVELLFKRRQREFIPPEPVLLQETYPKVSLHLAICNEPPDMVINTLNSLAQLDYPNYEVLVIDNNTSDDALWLPVQAHCQQLGAQFRFFTLGSWQGFKAGALNFALQQTAEDVDVIGVIDSDYLVESNWLRTLIPYFQDKKVGFVQAPQDHRDWEHDHFQEICNWEYAGFFHIGMVHRNENNAIIQHGTMTLIRKSALNEVGNWSEWCICEDAELGLNLMKHGYNSVYVNHAFGKGLTPQTFVGFKKQRFRWVYGATQILRHHWNALVKPNNSLTNKQRYHFLSGWFPWFADALSFISTIGAIFWSAALVIAPDYSRFPLDMFLITAFSLFVFKIVYGLLLYKALVPCTLGQRIGAAIAGMSLTHTIALGVIRGLLTSDQPFLRTPKAEDKPALIQGLLMVREELMMLVGLMVAIAAIINKYKMTDPDVIWWVIILSILSLPYLSALYMSLANVKPWRVKKV
jgi:exo-beta-1,3-glucanase (GH17 family)/cellulose synthase/poly-beta-1,6-N-acetylglucosamine synthase-like glycosyltransferase